MPASLSSNITAVWLSIAAFKQNTYLVFIGLQTSVAHEDSSTKSLGSTMITNDVNWMDDNNNDFIQNGRGGKISYIGGLWF